MKSRSRFIASVQEGSLYVLLFLLPFSKAVIEVMFGVLFIGWLLARCDPASRAQTIWCQKPLRWMACAVVLFLGVCALSVVVSDHHRLSLKGLVYKWLEYLLMFVMVADVASQPRVMNRSMNVLACSSLLVIIEGATQEIFGRGWLRGFPLIGFGRMTGPYENPIDLATYLMVVIPIILTLWMVRRGWSRWALSGLLLTLIVCLGRTESLGAWLGLIAGLLIFMGYNRSMRRYGLAVLAILLLVTGAWLLSTGHLRETVLLRDVGTSDRWMMWQAAMRMIRDRPILGHGVNTFMSNYLTYWVGGERQPRYAHNCYLQMAAETGLVGLLAFLGVLGVLFITLLKRLREMTVATDTCLLLGCTAGLLAFTVQAGVDTNFYSLRQATLFWILAGFAVGMSHKVNRDVGHSST